MDMSKATMPGSLRKLTFALALTLSIALFASTAQAAVVKLRVEGAKRTHFNGVVKTDGGWVPGGVDNPTGCRANSTPASFTKPNPLTALVAALGAKKVASSGTQFDWGTMLCSVAGEAPKDAAGGWLVRINQQDSTRKQGYATATDELKSGDSVLFYLSPSFGHFTAALELTGPKTVRAGSRAKLRVASYATANDAKTWANGARVSGAGASGKTAANGRVTLRFKRPGRKLIRATAGGAVRGTTWIIVKPKRR
jgi:hypothetical protein